MSTLVETEHAWRALTLGTDDDAADAFADVDSDRRRVYRELVHNNLLGVLKRACPHAVRLAKDAFVDVANHFLATRPIVTRFTRQIPGEFTTWLMAQPSATLPDAAFAELCHFEALEIDVLLAHTSDRAGADLVAGAQLVMDNSARLAVYRHPVHRVTATTTTWPTPSVVPSVVLCFQQAEVVVVEALSLALGKVLLHAAGGRTVDEAVAAVVDEAAAVGTLVEPGLLRAQLVSLQRRGAVAGFGGQS